MSEDKKVAVKTADKKVAVKTADKKVAVKTADKKVSDKSLQSVLSPHVTEKGTMVAEKFNQVVFKVKKNATKIQVKEAIESMFKVDVKAVNLLNVKGKTKQASRNTMGKRSDWKKAYVSIKAGQEINFTGE